MPSPSQPPHPTLVPSLCLSTDSLRSFLRLSRAAIDDPISQHLSSLSHPSEQPFDPASFSAARSAQPNRHLLPPASCAAFVSQTLFPAWAARARVLEYCAGVAETGTGEQGAGGGRPQWGGTIRGGSLAIGAGSVGPEVSKSQGRDQHSPTTGLVFDTNTLRNGGPTRIVDERLDPYSARDYNDETPQEKLARVLREEKTVESIVRSRSWGLIRDRCGGAVDGWEQGMKRWEGEIDRMAAKGTASGSYPTVEQEDGSSWGSLWSRIRGKGGYDV